MLTNEKSSSKVIGDKNITIKTGVMAKQANGSVLVECGSLTLLATAVMSKEPKVGINFFPLTIEYSEKMYASGKIPGGFFKREARPTTDATLIARLIDRPIRPCFPKTLKNDVQVIITVLSNDIDVCQESISIIAASAALSCSDIPFTNSVGAVVVGEHNGELIINPSNDILQECSLNIVVAGTKEAILMVEAGANEVSEETVIKAIALGHESIKEIVALQEELVAQAGKPKLPAPADIVDDEIENKINAILADRVEKNLQDGNKKETELFFENLSEEVITACVDETKENLETVKHIFNKLKKAKIRNAIIVNKVRPDGRKLDEIRPIESQVSILPTPHGSALFTRGETQSLGVVTLGTSRDEQMIDGLEETYTKDYYFHYNFPPYSVGETGRIGTGRRELGHGALAERSLKPVLPEKDKFPYTIRIVSEILESNGSSSMASVCSGTLSLMDCGVPIKAPVSGIAMGLLIEDGNYSILSDIQGLEDHYGDMDFKVAGTEKGITSLQLDIKVSGLSQQILKEALEQAKKGRLHILSKMLETINQPRVDISENAPRIEHVTIDPDKIGLLIGPGGKMIKSIQEETGATINIANDSSGLVCVSSQNKESLEAAINKIVLLTKDVEAGEEYVGKIIKVMPYGAFIEVLPGKEGLLHVSTFKDRVNAEEFFTEGQSITVVIKEIDKQNRISLKPKE
jgi:polyribonucleotide nucleotidyltransferase